MESFASLFKGCGFSGQSPESPSADGETPLFDSGQRPESTKISQIKIAVRGRRFQKFMFLLKPGSDTGFQGGIPLSADSGQPARLDRARKLVPWTPISHTRFIRAQRENKDSGLRAAGGKSDHSNPKRSPFMQLSFAPLEGIPVIASAMRMRVGSVRPIAISPRF